MWLAFYYLDESSPGHVAMSATAFFGIMWIGRAVDAVADPTAAHLSDRTRTRLGRRRTFLAIGVAPMCLFGALIFFPPASASVAVTSLVLALWLCLFWIGFTVYAVAYLALMSEMAPDHRTRVHLATLKATGTMVGVALVFILSPLLIRPAGFGGMVTLLAAVALVTGLVPILGVDERRYARGRPSTVPLLRSVRRTLTDRAFLVYLVSYLVFWLGFNVVTTGVPFYVKHLLHRPESTVSALMTVAFGVAVLAFPLVNRAALHLGLRRAFLLSMVLFALVLPLIYLWDQPPFGLEGSTLAYIAMGLTGLPLAGLFVLPDAIVSRLSRAAADAEGEGREAMYFGVQGFCMKLTFGISGSLMGLLFDLFGKGGASGQLGLKLTAPTAAVLVAVGCLIFWRARPEVLDG
jgi:GPH family glycoside/pentoside/hexuronide:cation symporter